VVLSNPARKEIEANTSSSSDDDDNNEVKHTEGSFLQVLDENLFREKP
jgi:hypothetical protein